MTRSQSGASPQYPDIQVVLADDHALMHRDLRLLLDAQDELTVIAEASELSSLPVQLRGKQADVLVLDLTTPYGASIEAIARLRKKMPRTQIVALSANDDPAFAQSVVAAGAIAVVLRQFADRDLPSAVRSAAAGERYLSPFLAASLSDVRRPLSGDRLTPREIDVLRLIALGHTSAEMARLLHLSPRTIETHRARIHRTLGLATRAELVRYALACGLLKG